MWRKHPESAARLRANVVAGFDQPHMMPWVYERDGGIDGFLFGALIDSEPIFDPGGQLSVIGDFALRRDGDWATLGADLLTAASEEAGRRGAVAAFVQCGHYDSGKRALLDSQRFGPGWSYRTRDLVPGNATAELRPMTADDFDTVIALAEGERTAQGDRRIWAGWRKAADSAEKYRAELTELIADESWMLRVHEAGYIRAKLSAEGPPVWDPGGKVCFVTEFMFKDPGDWPTLGASMLSTVTAEAHKRGAVAALVQYADYHTAKRQVLEELGYGPAWSYRTRDL